MGRAYMGHGGVEGLLGGGSGLAVQHAQRGGVGPVTAGGVASCREVAARSGYGGGGSTGRG